MNEDDRYPPEVIDRYLNEIDAAPAVAEQLPVTPHKPSRWDRPPEPHDWRFVVGHLGRTLITVGLMMFGFVGYQLWGTGIQEARSQDKLAKDFGRAIEAAGNTSTTVTTSPTPTGSDPIVPTTAPAPPGPPDQPFPHTIAEGEGIASLKIPRIDLSKYVVAGVGVSDLRKGVGHFPNTPFPGQLGNSAIAGHRTTYGQPFYSLDKLKPGDEIVVSTILGGTYVYVVTGSEVVGQDDYHVISDSDPKKATLTLITCTPIGTASRRLVIHSELDQTRSSPVGKAALYYGQPAPDGAAAGTPSLPGDINAATSTIARVATSAPTQATSIPSTTTTPTAITATQTGGFSAPTDAFSQGWFSDKGAFLPVAIWGLILLAIWRGAYVVARRKRRLWLGFAVGFAPFMFVLYFFFENVNRLLPTAI